MFVNNFRHRKKYIPKSGISRFSIENILSHNTEKHRRGTHLRFTNFLVSKHFMNLRCGEGGREGVSKFSVKGFCPTVPRNFVGEPFSVSIFSVIDEFMPK